MIITHAFSQGWFHLKALFIILFIGYCHYLNRIRKNQINKICKLTSKKLRIINELPTLFLAAIVFTVFFRNLFSGLWAAGVVILVIILVGLAIQRKRSAQLSVTYDRELKDGYTQTRYAFKAQDDDGTNLTKFCSKADFESLVN